MARNTTTEYNVYLDAGDLLVVVNMGGTIEINGVRPYATKYNDIAGLTFLPAATTGTQYTSVQMGWVCDTAGTYTLRLYGVGANYTTCFYAPVQS